MDESRAPHGGPGQPLDLSQRPSPLANGDSLDSASVFERDMEKCKLNAHIVSSAKTEGEPERRPLRCTDAMVQPIRWIGMMCRELNASFIFGVIVMYGVTKGFGGALYKIAGGYYWKDEQKVQPSVAQLYHGIIFSAGDWKPVWGLLTDLVPVAGYRRRPYFILSGLLSLISILVVVAHSKLHAASAVILLLLYILGVAIAQVTLDADITRQSREKPNLAADIQTLCSMSEAMGHVVGFSMNGFIVHYLGPKNALGLLSMSGALFLVLGSVLHELRLSKQSLQSYQVAQRFKRTYGIVCTTISCPQVWKPTLYMFISWASSPSVDEGKFYWYTDKERGLGFSQEFVSISFAVGSIGAFLGGVIYQTLLKNCSFRKILLGAQILVFFGGSVDLLLVLRWNLKLHVSDALFFLFDETLGYSVHRLKWIPQLILCTKLCPTGIEGTFFALLMSVDSIGFLTARSSGAILQHGLGITRDDYNNLWLAILIRNVLRLLPLGALFLVPDANPSSQVIPPELVAIGDEGGDEEEEVELVEKAAPNQHD